MQRLRDAALPLVAERGIDEIRAEDLAEALGISRRTFFRYFPVKEDVVVGAFAEIGVRLASASREMTAGGPFDIDAMKGLLTEATRDGEFYGSGGRARFALILETPALRARFLGLLEDIAERLARSLAAAGAPAARSSLFVRLTLTLLVEATDRWSKDAARPIADQVDALIGETRLAMR